VGPPASHGVTRVPWYSGADRVLPDFAYEAFTLFGCTFQCYSAILLQSLLSVHNPLSPKTYGLGSFPFARRYSENRSFFLFLRLLRCFSSPGSLLTDYLFHLWVTHFYLCRVSPFGYLRVITHLQLSAAFRSLSRPSSAPNAKAFTLRSF
jgi:hypothetical protein